MIRLTDQKSAELNEILRQLKKLLPEVQFRYSDNTGLLENVTFDFQRESSVDVTYFVSLPKFYPYPNLLRKSVREPSSRCTNKEMSGDPAREG
jgi:hypothetical protein